MASKQVLVGDIRVEFHTNNDDKDADTYVQCNILPYVAGVQTEIIASCSSNLGGHLDDNSLSPVVNLNFWSEEWYAGNEYLFQLILDPNGHDTWRFGVNLYITYRYPTDNFEQPVKTYPFPNHALSQDVRMNQFVFML